MFIGIVPAVDLHVAHFFLDVRAGDVQCRDAVYGVYDQAESVDFVLNRQFQRCVDTAFFFITADMQVFMVVAAIGKAVYQPGIAVEIEKDGFVQRK